VDRRANLVPLWPWAVVVVVMNQWATEKMVVQVVVQVMDHKARLLDRE
jgi:hypothetical protein